jgi:hypothetical protein
MEDWQIDFEWLRVRHYIKDTMQLDKIPDMEVILLFVGIQELGQLQEDYSKEEKQDLMHIAVCTLLSQEGFEYYELEGYDADNYPHFKLAQPLPYSDVKAQEVLLKRAVVQYFELPPN